MAQPLAMPLALSFSVNCYGGKPIRSSSSKVSFPVSTTPKHRGLTIRCARVGGIEIPNNKRIEASLQYIHGIGRTIARQILNDLNYENKLTYNLSEEELVIIRDEVAKYRTEGDLRRFNAMSIKRLKDIRCYRGVRHTKGLPCRGQRTKNNCRTLKGKRVAVPGKKKATR